MSPMLNLTYGDTACHCFKQTSYCVGGVPGRTFFMLVDVVRFSHKSCPAFRLCLPYISTTDEADLAVCTSHSSA